jgi:hypothetical protein
MLTISEAQRRTELFLTGQMLEALRAVEYELPSFDTQLHDVDLAEVARARVEIPGAEPSRSTTGSALRCGLRISLPDVATAMAKTRPPRRGGSNLISLLTRSRRVP